ncbi:hypothetical protein IAQ61_001054, partial [Plenodomus lingam]|uniref:uncharacterized protein n=1 Tax=Leptosphaeria maculans TaxID=5022 RepID=UPI0033170064
DLEIGGISIIVGCGIAEHCPFPLEAAGSKANIWGKGWIPIGSQRLSKASESLNWLASSKDADNAHLGPWPPSSALHVARRKGHGSLLSVMAEKCEACRTRQKYKDNDEDWLSLSGDSFLCARESRVGRGLKERECLGKVRGPGSSASLASTPLQHCFDSTFKLLVTPSQLFVTPVADEPPFYVSGYTTSTSAVTLDASMHVRPKVAPSLAHHSNGRSPANGAIASSR